MNIEELLAGAYKPLFPELLSMYNVDIEWECSMSSAWSGKVWKERDDQEGWYTPIVAVNNAGTGGCNVYYHITSNADFNNFKRTCEKCFPNASDYMDYACIYLELREAKKQQDAEEL